jgi:hypothetical protein
VVTTTEFDILDTVHEDCAVELSKESVTVVLCVTDPPSGIDLVIGFDIVVLVSVSVYERLPSARVAIVVKVA